MPHNTIPRPPTTWSTRAGRTPGRGSASTRSASCARSSSLSMPSTTRSRASSRRAPDQAYLDAHAIAAEHELDPTIHSN